MDNKKIIIGIVIGVLLLGLIFGLYVGFSSEKSGSGESTSSSSTFPVIFASWIPIFVVIMALQRPEYPVENIIQILAYKKYDVEKKKRKLQQFIGNEFKDSENYNKLLQEDIVKYMKIKTINEKSDNPTIQVTLKDFSQYEFVVVKRDKKIDPKGSTKWVIKDYKKSDF